MIRYIAVLPTIAMVVMAFVMLVTIRLLSIAAVDTEIKRELRKSIEENRRYVSVDRDEVKVEDDFQFQRDHVTFLLVRRNGYVIAGEYPKETEAEFYDYHAVNNYSSTIVCGGTRYYVRDVRIGRDNEKGVFIRGIIKKSDADSFYQNLETVAYITVVCVMAVILTCEIVFAGKISRELKMMCRTAEGIGLSLDMSQRMKCDNQFYEIEILAQANNRMLDRMEQTMKLQEQFTSDVAHELRTPVAVLLAQCQYVMGNEVSGEEIREFIEVVHRQSGKMDTLILQLLKLSRLDQDRMEIQYETLDLKEIVQSVCEEWQEKSEESVKFRFDFQEVYSRGDISLISIVILNLITNAVKFSDPGGFVDVVMGKEDKWVYVSVRDYGIGMQPEEMEHIFHRFYKCDKSRNAEGFGLGLPLSEKIEQKHGGYITVESEPGKGSIFTLYLPDLQP